MAGNMSNRPDERPRSVRAWVDRWLNAPTDADPLYLTNRTLGQKLRLWILVGVPCLAMGVLVWIGLTGRFAPEAPPAAPAVAPAKAASRLPATLDDLHISSNRDLQVLDAHVVHGKTTTIEGTILNNSERLIYAAEVVLDLTDGHGSQLGGVTVRVDHLEPKVRVPFKMKIPEPNAAFALVREIHTL